MNPANDDYQFDPDYTELISSLTRYSRVLIKRGEDRALSNDEKLYLIEDIKRNLKPDSIFPVLKCLLQDDEDF